MAELNRDRFRVGEWTVEPSLNRIRRDGREIRLEPRVMDLLVHLAGRAGEVASRTEIIDALWAEQYVADSVLTRAVSLLRDAWATIHKCRAMLRRSPSGVTGLVAPVTSRTAPAEDNAIPIITIGERQWLLTAEETVIGRGADATIRLDQTRVSRRHARIRRVGAGAEIEDLDSKNGTLVNGVPVESPVTLFDGDQIIIGPVVAVYRQPWATSTVTGAASTAEDAVAPRGSPTLRRPLGELTSSRRTVRGACSLLEQVPRPTNRLQKVPPNTLIHNIFLRTLRDQVHIPSKTLGGDPMHRTRQHPSWLHTTV